MIMAFPVYFLKYLIMTKERIISMSREFELLNQSDETIIIILVYRLIGYVILVRAVQ